MRKSTLNRMLELSNIKPVIKEGKMNLSNFELVKKSINGKTYAIVRENRNYHIKETQTKEKLMESDFDYIGGYMNKMKKSFNSFSDATKHLNLMFEEINNHYDVKSTNILESDSILTEKKFVLKLNKKKTTKPTEEPASEESGEEEEFSFGSEEGGEDEFDFDAEEESGSEEEFDFDAEEDTEEDTEEEFDFDAEEGDAEEGDAEESVEEFGGEEEEDLELDDSEDGIKDIQSTTGKLGQQLRDVEDISSDMQKWVAKSVLSALDLDTMDSEDKKDIIRTVKKKSKEEEPEEDVESSEEEFDFEDEGVEESYDSYMDDNSGDIDQMVSGDKIPYPGGSGIPKRPFVKQETNPRIRRPERPLVKQETNPIIRRPERPLVKQDDNHMGDYEDSMDGMDNYDWDGVDVEVEFPSYEDVYNTSEETEIVNGEYDSNMSDKSMEKIDEFLMDMEETGILEPSNDYDSHMSDDANIALALDRPNPNLIEDEDTEIGGDEDDKVANPDDKNVEDKLLLDVEEDMGFEEMDALYGPNSKKYDRSDPSRAMRQASKDISTHYNKPAAPGYDLDPVEKWAKHKLPYDTEFMGEGDYMTEDHLNDEMETYEQEQAYEDVETVVRRYGMDVELREKATSEDPEESLIYLDIVDGSTKLLVARINSVGDIEVGEMRGNKFTGEPLDSVEDFIEIFDEDLTNKEKQELDMEESVEMSPQPQRAPEEQPSQPETKPGTPDKTPGKDRPSRRPFSPPPSIDPNDPDSNPAPKAPAPEDSPTMDNDVEFGY